MCRIMIDGLWGKASMLCSQSLVPFSTYLGNPTWPALRMGSGLFLGLCSVRLATAFEIWPRLIKLHESSSLSSRNLRLILAHGCKAGLRGSQQLQAAVQKQSRFFSLALDVKFGSHSFTPVCSSFHHRSSCREQLCSLI